jgi:hypothetical protein
MFQAIAQTRKKALKCIEKFYMNQQVFFVILFIFLNDSD